MFSLSLLAHFCASTMHAYMFLIFQRNFYIFNSINISNVHLSEYTILYMYLTYVYTFTAAFLQHVCILNNYLKAETTFYDNAAIIKRLTDEKTNRIVLYRFEH